MTHYIDPENGSGDGSSPENAAREVNPQWLRPGATILFKRGTTIRGDLPKFSGTPDAWATIGAYGEGPRPVFMKSTSLASADLWVNESANLWANDSANIWRCTLPLSKCANLIYDDGAFCGAKRWKKDDLHREGDWYDEGETLFVYCTENPGKRYRAIEWVPPLDFIRFIEGDQYITIQDIHIKNAGVHGFWVSGGHHIVLRRCDASYIGGAVFPSNFGVPDGLTVRYGNGFEVWCKGHHIMVEGCRFWQVYDGAICLQGLKGELIHDVSFRGCVMWDNSFDSFDWSWGVACRNIYFENNTCLGAGRGWGFETEGRPRLSAFLPDAVGWHFFITDVTVPSTFYVRNNIFADAPKNPILKFRCSKETMRDIVLDYNCYHQPDPTDPLAFYEGKLYAQNEFAAYREASGKDTHSILADPGFANPAAGNWRLKETSPCKNTGFDTTQSPPFEGMPRSEYAGKDIGARIDENRPG